MSLAGQGLRDVTRVAAGDPLLWQQILSSNASSVAELLQEVRDDLDLPRVSLPADVGDVTIHCSCVLHMSRPPVSRERRVVYTGFGLAPRPGDVVREGDRDSVRRARADLDDAGRRLNQRGYGAKVQQFELDV